MFFKKNHSGDDTSKKSKSNFKTVLPKVLSIIAALVLWFYVYDSKSVIEEKTFTNIPIVFENFDESKGLKIVSGENHSIDIMVSGTKSDLAKITKEDIRVTADLNGVDDVGTASPTINVSVPSDVDIVKKSASKVAVKIDQTIKTHAKVDVELIYDNIDINKYEIDDNFMLSEDLVAIEGPKSDVEKVEKLVAQIKVGEIKSSFKSNATLVPVDKYGNTVNSPYITLAEKNVTVTITVLKMKSVPVKAVFADNNYSYNVQFNPDKVIIKGESSLVDSIKTVSTAAINAIEPKSGTVDLKTIAGIEIFNAYDQSIDEVGFTINSVTLKTNETDVNNENNEPAHGNNVNDASSESSPEIKSEENKNDE